MQRLFYHWQRPTMTQNILVDNDRRAGGGVRTWFGKSPKVIEITLKLIWTPFEGAKKNPHPPRLKLSFLVDKVLSSVKRTPSGKPELRIWKSMHHFIDVAFENAKNLLHHVTDMAFEGSNKNIYVWTLGVSIIYGRCIIQG